MRVLFFGDVVGRSGRDALIAALPDLIRRTEADFTVVNGENAAGGFGLNPEIAQSFFAAGVGCVTTGNHVWDQRQIIAYLETEPRVLRPINFPPSTPGRGAHVYPVSGNRKIMVANVMGRLFMDPLDDPFQVMERELTKHSLGKSVQAMLVDVHAEASSEKLALAHYLDGRVSAVIGTHTHVPTADARVLAKGTAYQTDAGMCGDYDSVIGMTKEISVTKFVRKMPGDRMTPAEGPATVCGCLIEIADSTGLATSITPIRQGGLLAQT